MRNVVIVLVVLLAVWGIIKIKENKQGDRSFKAHVVEVDTALVSHISITPKGKTESVELAKQGNNWMLNLGKKMVQADQGMATDLLSQVMELKPKRVAATTKSKWTEYEVDDSLGTRIKLFSGKKVLADFVLGKFSYSQGQGANPYQQRNVIMTSYIRPFNEETVYAVDGYLSMMFNRDKSAFRNSMVVNSKPENWNKLVFSYPADSSFTLEKQNGKWIAGGMVADSASVAQYFSKVQRLNGGSFDEISEIEDSQQPAYFVRIEGDHMNPIEVKAYTSSLGEEVFVSSENKGNVFNDSKIKETLFINKKQLLEPTH